MVSTTSHPKYLSIGYVAKVLKVSPGAVRDWENRPDFPARPIRLADSPERPENHDGTRVYTPDQLPLMQQWYEKQPKRKKVSGHQNAA